MTEPSAEADRLMSLAKLSRQARRDIIQMSYQAGAGHIPSALSMVDYLAVVFSGHVDPHQDRLVLGKPFGAQAYYALFAGRGWIKPAWERYASDDPEWRYIIGHEHPLVTYVDDTMGNALAVACGIAMAFPGRVYINSSDAALQEGTVWESLLFAGHHRLSNLLLTIDRNQQQVLGKTEEILGLEPLSERLSVFGWQVKDVDGHDHMAIDRVLSAVGTSGRPTAVVCKTVKGRGLGWMENDSQWHYRTLDLDRYHAAMEALR